MLTGQLIYPLFKQGAEDVCFLNFVVFVVWDYAPALWILLTMTTSVGVNRGGYAGSAVVKVRLGGKLA